MSWFGKLFATDKAVDSLLDTDKGLLVRAGGWVNDLQYTDQEKAENSLLVKQWGIRQLEALEPFKVVQRIIAFSVTFLWMFVGVNIAIDTWVRAITTPGECPEGMECTGIDAVTPFLEFAFSDYVFWPVLAVLSLYFTGGVIKSPKSNAKS